jgi:tetratricopeptide (TPR) repeat protein
MSLTPWSDAKPLASDLAQALREFDWCETERLCNVLVKRLNAAADPFPVEDAAGILKALRRKRQFASMALVGDAFIDGGQDDAEIRRQFGQAQIELGQLRAAEKTLREVIAQPDDDRREWAEAMGLVGRIYKQRYVEAKEPRNPRQQRNLRQAIASYHEVYASDPAQYFWQGINAVALLARAERDEVDPGETLRLDFRGIAKDILESLAAREKRERGLAYWARATRMEAHIALRDFASAHADLRAYVLDDGVDAFECASTLRQLREVWGLDEDTEPGTSLIELLKRALLKREGGEITLMAKEIKRGLEASFEANFSGALDLPLNWWKAGLARCAAVARIEDVGGRRIGSGFLVRRDDFLQETGPPLLLTNWHVVSERGEHPWSIAPEAAAATFEATGRTFKVATKMPAYCRKLDASFLDLENADGLDDFCPLVPPVRSVPDKKARLYVIGYPGGRGLSFSIHDSVWLDSDDTKLHYRTPTESGSSGSPVFDESNWTLVALHHAGLTKMPKLKGQPGTYEANEGIAISAIQKALKATLRS